MGVYQEEVIITGEEAGLESALAKASRQVKASAASWSSAISSAGKSIDNFGSGLMRVGRSLSTYVSLPIAAVGAASVFMAARFEFAMQKLVSFVGIGQAEVEKMKASVLSLAAATGRGPMELANALYFVTSAGLRGQKALDVLDASAKAAASGMGDTATIASTATSVMVAYANSHITAAHALDIMIRATKDGKMAVDALGAAVGPVLGIAAQAGVSFDQLAAAIASASRQGVPVTRMVTGLRFMLQSLLVPTKAAASHIDDVFGSVANLQKALADPSIGLLGVLTKLKDNLPFADFAKTMGGARGMVGALTLVGKNATQVKGIFDDVTHSTGALNTAFGVASHTASFQFHQAWATIQVDLIAIGQRLLPIVLRVVKDVTTEIQKAITWFDHLSSAQQTNILKWLGIAGAAGPALLVLGGVFRVVGTGIRVLGFMTSGIEGIVGAMAQLGLAGPGATAAISGMGGAAAGEVGAVGGLAAALGPVGLVGAVLLLAMTIADHGKDITDFFKGLSGGGTSSRTKETFGGDVGSFIHTAIGLDLHKTPDAKAGQAFTDIAYNQNSAGAVKTLQELAAGGYNVAAAYKAWAAEGRDVNQTQAQWQAQQNKVLAALNAANLTYAAQTKQLAGLKTAWHGLSAGMRDVGSQIISSNNLTVAQKSTLMGLVGTMSKTKMGLTAEQEGYIMAAAAAGNYGGALDELQAAMKAQRTRMVLYTDSLINSGMPADKAIARLESMGRQAGLTQAQINVLIGRVKNYVASISVIPASKQTRFEQPGMLAALGPLAHYLQYLSSIPPSVSTKFITDYIYTYTKPPPGYGGARPSSAAGAILAGATGFLTTGPTFMGNRLVGESPSQTFAGRGTEAVLPFDSRGIGILSQALSMALAKGGMKGGGPMVVIQNPVFFGERDFERRVTDIVDRAVARKLGGRGGR